MEKFAAKPTRMKNEIRYNNLNEIRKGDERRGCRKYAQNSGSDIP
jgi:hypothetical protein